MNSQIIESFNGEYIVEIIHDQYTKKIPIHLRVDPLGPNGLPIGFEEVPEG